MPLYDEALAYREQQLLRPRLLGAMAGQRPADIYYEPTGVPKWSNSAGRALTGAVPEVVGSREDVGRDERSRPVHPYRTRMLMADGTEVIVDPFGPATAGNPGTVYTTPDAGVLAHELGHVQRIRGGDLGGALRGGPEKLLSEMRASIEGQRLLEERGVAGDSYGGLPSYLLQADAGDILAAEQQLTDEERRTLLLGLSARP